MSEEIYTRILELGGKAPYLKSIELVELLILLNYLSHKDGSEKLRDFIEELQSPWPSLRAGVEIIHHNQYFDKLHENFKESREYRYTILTTLSFFLYRFSDIDSYIVGVSDSGITEKFNKWIENRKKILLKRNKSDAFHFEFKTLTGKNDVDDLFDVFFNAIRLITTENLFTAIDSIRNEGFASLPCIENQLRLTSMGEAPIDILPGIRKSIHNCLDYLSNIEAIFSKGVEFIFSGFVGSSFAYHLLNHIPYDSYQDALIMVEKYKIFDE